MRKHFLLILLCFNVFFGCIYFIHERKEEEIIPILSATNTKISNIIFQRQQYNQYVIKTNKAIEFIKNTLENEYNQNDLMNFYNHVQKEYSLGLRCTRIQNISKTMAITNTTDRIENNTRIISTRASSSFSTLTSSRKHLSSRRFQRTDLYTFIIDNSDACLNEFVDLVIIIISKSDNYKTRDAIRRTWASGKDIDIYSTINIKFFFLIDFNEKLIHHIRLENNLFHDIIQVELLQEYTLVTHRVLSLFEWSFRYCRTAKFLFKTDDDVFINLILLLKFISPLIKQPINNSFLISDMHIYGYKHKNARVFRHSKNLVSGRYIVTHDEYPCERYPTFLSGFGYLISKKARDAILYTAYQDLEPFRISDVYLTGIIPDYLSIPRQPLSDYKIEFIKSCDHFFRHSKAFACADSIHHGNTSDTFDKFNQYWQLIKKKHRSIQ
ncbi:unnamed protein product [Rotaria sordida]|uniref:Hexosyltransferase n=1 Tax=Rotaria sordida TaxID=392033 RepID=A0A819FEG7_9BILA|nr:unnamed protein product [Rotaria sordida]CAF3866305.1 unnamed protein product [Rotaria sordida]